MADYLQHIVTCEVDLQSLISNHSIHFNHVQCEFLGSKLHLAVEQAKILIEVHSRFPEDYTPVHLLRAFYWQVEGDVTLVEKFCENSWLSMAAAGAQSIESFALACQELQWFTTLFKNLCSQSESTFEGILELAGQKETVETVATLAYQDGEALKLKLGDVLVHGSPSDQVLARNLLQKLQNVGREPQPDLWTLDAKELILGKSIERGSTGIVYTTTWLNATHALKVFSLGYREIFEKEVAILARLNHPHVLPMIGCAVDLWGNCMLVVELMDEDQDTFIARNTLKNPLPLDKALNLMLQIGEGVKYLHQQGHSSFMLKPMSEVLNIDIPNYNHILSMNVGRTYNKFTILKNNKIVDLITHRELTSEEIYKRTHWRQLITGALSIRPPYFWPPPNAHHMAAVSHTNVGLSSWINKINKMMRAPHVA